MHTPPRKDELLDKWRRRTLRERAEVITAFLDQYGEHASLEEWRDFLHKNQANGF